MALEFSVLNSPLLGCLLFPCRERERREKEREEWERQYSRQSRSPSPRYSECPEALGVRTERCQNWVQRLWCVLMLACHVLNLPG